MIPRNSARWAFLPAVLVLALLPVDALAQADSPARRAAERLPLTPCTVEGVDEELLCGSLEVPENRAEPAGRRISLNVLVVPALAADPVPDPVVNLMGGPGVAAGIAAEDFVRWMPQFRQNRDVLLVDQRGTGASNPLHCNLTSTEPNPHGLLNEMYPPEAVERCRNELEAVADLRFYTTEVAVRDLEDVRAWLGYERLNLFGTSYGSRVALVYLREFPGRVRSALLVGATATDLLMPSRHARDGHRAMDLLLETCLADEACRTAFPGIREEWSALLERLAREPADFTYVRPETGEAVRFIIERDIFAEVIRSRLYAPVTMRRLPLVIHRAYRGDFGPYLELASLEWEPRPPFLAEGMYLSVTCSEDLPFIDYAETAEINRDLYFRNYRVEQQLRACGLWPRGEISERHHDPVRSEAPVLIVSGRMDPVTPPGRGDEVARRLPNSRHVVVPEMAHSPAGMTRIDCLIGIMAGFVDRPSPGEVDASCVREMRFPPFDVPAER